MDNSFTDLYTQQIAAQTQAMQAILKANQQAYESFQMQIMKINERTQDTLTASAQDFVRQFKADCEKYIAEMKRQAGK